MVSLRLGNWCRRNLVYPLTATIIVAVALAAAMARAAEPIKVPVDQAKLIKLPERASTVVVGNPLIADVSVQPGSMIVVTGKGYGTTNLVALDRKGGVLMERQIEVQGPTDPVVVLYRGVARETYSCTPKCEPRITLGDAKQYFTPTIVQTVTRSTQAQHGGTAR
jgi:hypothetical protein